MQKIGPFLLFITMLTSGICWGGWWGEGKQKKKYMLCSRILLKSYLPFLAQLKKKKSLLAANKHRYRIIRKRRWGQGCFFHIYGGNLDESLLPRKSALLSGPLPVCSLPSGYSRAEEFALPVVSQPAAWFQSHERKMKDPPACRMSEVPCAEKASLERSPLQNAWPSAKTGAPRRQRLRRPRAALVPLQEQSGDPQMKWALPTGRIPTFLDVNWNNY